MASSSALQSPLHDTIGVLLQEVLEDSRRFEQFATGDFRVKIFEEKIHVSNHDAKNIEYVDRMTEKRLESSG